LIEQTPDDRNPQEDDTGGQLKKSAIKRPTLALPFVMPGLMNSSNYFDNQNSGSAAVSPFTSNKVTIQFNQTHS
jgi:hypothetical protein